MWTNFAAAKPPPMAANFWYEMAMLFTCSGWTDVGRQACVCLSTQFDPVAADGCQHWLWHQQVNISVGLLLLPLLLLLQLWRASAVDRRKWRGSVQDDIV